MSIDDRYWSPGLGKLYFSNIEKDMSKFSEVAKEINTSLENVLRYVIIQKLYDFDDGFLNNGLMDILAGLDEIKDSIVELQDTIENKE